MSKKIKIGIVGFGEFGKFIAPLLSKYAEVYIYVKAGKENTLKKSLKGKNDIYVGSDESISELDYFIFSVPLQSLEESCKIFKKKLNKKTVIVDVTSVKVKPLAIIKKHFKGFKILGTHPIFGPQSGKNGLEGLPIVLCNISLEKTNYAKIKAFLKREYGLLVIEKTPDEHDREVAYIQGLSHMIGRAIINMDIKDFDIATKSYRQLLGLKDLLKNDSLELYKTIQNGNPYTKKVRAEFLKNLNDLENIIKK